MTEEEKLEAIILHFSYATFPNGEVVLVRATHREFGFIAERPNSAHQYLQVCRGYKESYYRIKFALVNGHLPPIVDHRDGNRENDAITNLRSATPQQNAQNRGKVKRKDGSNLPRGVYPRARAGGRTVYEAACHYRKDGNAYWKSLGYYDTIEEAETAFNEFTKAEYGEYFREHSKASKDKHGER